MIKPYLTRFFISAILYLIIFFSAVYFITPLALVNFVGPSAALISGLILVWGVSPIVVVILLTPLFTLLFHHFFHLEVNLAVMLIAILSIILQGIWTKQLTLKQLSNKKWLSTRKQLFWFLLRIGPIASLVSASAVLVISMLDNQVLQGTLLYTFIHTWATSTLVSVFFIPLIIMAINSEHFTVTKRVFVTVTSALGALAIFLLLKTSQYEQQKSREAVFNQSKGRIERLVLDEIDMVVNKTNSLSAFFKASKETSYTEFSVFSESIFEPDSSVRALEWAPIIPLIKKNEFEQSSTKELQIDYKIKERLANGQIGLADIRNQYAPLFYIYPLQGNSAALGLDVFSNPLHILSMKKVVDEQDIVASAPITLIQDGLANPAILFSKAVYSPVNRDELSEANLQEKLPFLLNEALVGFVVSVVQFERFFERIAKDESLEVEFFIQDITSHTPFTLFGQAVTAKNRNVGTITMPVFSRLWQIDIAENKPWFSQAKSWQAWAVLVGGTTGAFLFQMLILMMAAYSNELGQQVHIKTRALILAKENSEQKSFAKSHFLQTLNTEVRVPLLALKSFVEQLKKKGINNKEVTGISHAGSNVELLLDTMMDLSNIESGKVTPKEDCFDLYGFLGKTESVLKATNAYKGKSIFFLIDESVPHYINSDELYLQKLLHALIESAHHVLKTDMIRLSIKLHKHKLSEASLFFTLSSQEIKDTNYNDNTFNERTADNLVANSTSLSMAIKYSQLLRGDTNLGTLSSGDGVLNASIRVTISSIEQQELQQGLTFDLMG